MFVEIARLLIVLLSTGAGYAIASSSAPDGSPTAVLGAVLGALFGYVLGGAAARALRRGMGRVEATVERTPPAQLLGGGFGAALLGGLSLLLGIPAVVLLPARPMVGVVAIAAAMPVAALAALLRPALLCLALAAALLGVGRAELPAADPLLPARAASLAGSVVAITGQVGRPGTGLHPLRGQNNVQGASDAGLIPMFYPDYQPVDRPATWERFERAYLLVVPLFALHPGGGGVSLGEALRRIRDL